MCVCVGALGWWWSKTFVSPMPPQVGLAQSPTYQRSIGNLVPGGKNSVLNWVLKLNHLFKLFEVLNLVFACICNEKGFKVIKLWNTSDTSVLYSVKSTRLQSRLQSPSYPRPPSKEKNIATIVSLAFHVIFKRTIYT